MPRHASTLTRGGRNEDGRVETEVNCITYVDFLGQEVTAELHARLYIYVPSCIIILVRIPLANEFILTTQSTPSSPK